MDFPSRSRLHSPADMYKTDDLAIKSGISGADLMENAGKAVYENINKRWQSGKAIILCGPGNNGGDGFVVARHLQENGWNVDVFLFALEENLKGDAAIHAKKWLSVKDQQIKPFADVNFDGCDIVIDALFGAGLARDLDDGLISILKTIPNQTPVIAVDIPTGIDGENGQICGFAIKPNLTVTFSRPKTGHYLLPGRLYCGELVVADIGHPEEVIEQVSSKTALNSPDLWLSKFPKSSPYDHKYSRGYAAIAAGIDMLGASKLAARAAGRIGAGIVGLMSPMKVAPLYQVSLDSPLVHAYRDTASYQKLIEDERINACLIGPGLGWKTGAYERVQATLRSGKITVYDADALNLYENSRDLFFKAMSAPSLLTPHAGEFARFFPEFANEDKFSAVQKAAKLSNCTIILKGYDTIIAAPDGRCVINANAPSDLATAGAGDVLAGLCVGLLAQSVPIFEAACMACWIHGAAATEFGPGLLAEDLIDIIPQILQDLCESQLLLG